MIASIEASSAFKDLSYGSFMPKTDPNITDKRGTSLFMVLCTKPAHPTWMVLFDKMLAKGANVNFIRREDLKTPFLVAAAHGQTWALTKLVDAGVDVHVIDSHGSNAITLASGRYRSGTNPDYDDAVDYLLSIGVNPSIRNTFNKTALHHAIDANNYGAAIALVKREIVLTDNDCVRILSQTMSGYSKMFPFLLRNGFATRVNMTWFVDFAAKTDNHWALLHIIRVMDEGICFEGVKYELLTSRLASNEKFQRFVDDDDDHAYA